MTGIVSVQNLSKTYGSGQCALKDIDLEITRGEIFGLLGPNGAGKSTLIHAICGIVNASSGSITVAGHNAFSAPRAARRVIGLVPQELHTDAFETVWNTVNFSRGLFGLAPSPNHIQQILEELSLWDKRHSSIMALSGGMKRRVLIAKALAHEPEVLFLDEPTAGVDVELRRDMWRLVRKLKATGVTIILTTHYIEEAEELADRIGIIRGGELLLVEQKDTLMKKLGRRQLKLSLSAPLSSVPKELAAWNIELAQGGSELSYQFESRNDDTSIPKFLDQIDALNISYVDLETRQSSLEEIFVDLVSNNNREVGHVD